MKITLVAWCLLIGCLVNFIGIAYAEPLPSTLAWGLTCQYDISDSTINLRLLTSTSSYQNIDYDWANSPFFSVKALALGPYYNYTDPVQGRSSLTPYGIGYSTTTGKYNFFRFEIDVPTSTATATVINEDLLASLVETTFPGQDPINYASFEPRSLIWFIRDQAMLIQWARCSTSPYEHYVYTINLQTGNFSGQVRLDSRGNYQCANMAYNIDQDQFYLLDTYEEPGNGHYVYSLSDYEIARQYSSEMIIQFIEKFFTSRGNTITLNSQFVCDRYRTGECIVTTGNLIRSWILTTTTLQQIWLEQERDDFLALAFFIDGSPSSVPPSQSDYGYVPSSSYNTGTASSSYGTNGFNFNASTSDGLAGGIALLVVFGVILGLLALCLIALFIVVVLFR